MFLNFSSLKVFVLELSDTLNFYSDLKIRYRILSRYLLEEINEG
jgi:hypothetical protein